MRGIHEIAASNEAPHAARLDEHFGASHHDEDTTEYRSFDTNLAAKNRRDAAAAAAARAAAATILLAGLAFAERHGSIGIMDRIHSAIDAKTPFLNFWQHVNEAREAQGRNEAVYKEAKELYDGGPTPVGAMAFIGKQWDGLRAVPAEPVKFLGGRRPAYHGEYKAEGDYGNVVWLKVLDDRSVGPKTFLIPEAAITAAEAARNNDAQLRAAS